MVKVTQRSKDQEKQIEIPYAGIKKANLVVEL
jgi:ribosome maturation factor RimP